MAHCRPQNQSLRSRPPHFVPPHLSHITRLTLRWLESADRETAITARNELVDLLTEQGNRQEQIDYWLSYAAEMSAVQGETLADEVIETEAILARMQGLIK